MRTSSQSGVERQWTQCLSTSKIAHKRRDFNAQSQGAFDAFDKARFAGGALSAQDGITCRRDGGRIVRSGWRPKSAGGAHVHSTLMLDAKKRQLCITRLGLLMIGVGHQPHAELTGQCLFLHPTAACPRGRSIAQADDGSWHRPDLCHRNRRSSTAGRDLCQVPRLRRLARSHTASKIDRRQAEARGDIQNGEHTLRRLLIIGSSATSTTSGDEGERPGESRLWRKLFVCSPRRHLLLYACLVSIVCLIALAMWHFRVARKSD